MNETYLPALSRTSLELATLLRDLDRMLTDVYRKTEDTALKETLETLMGLERKIGRFFGNIRDLLTSDSRSEQDQFITQFFFRQYSIISENSRAARSILKYVLGDLSWFSAHSARIIEVLKTLYAELLTLQIECRDQYRKFTGHEMDASFDFSTNGLLSASPGMSEEEALRRLSLSDGATKDEVKAAFRRLAKEFHPDLNPEASREGFIDLEKAYRTLLAGVS